MSTPPELNSGDPALTLSDIFPIKIVLPGVAALFIIFLVVLIVYFRVKNQSDPFSSSRIALDTAVLNALPITVFSSTNSDCAICLADFSDGELGRRLPRCGHEFHLECIDEWFLVDSICRSSVDPPRKLPASFSGTKSATFIMEVANMDIKMRTLHPTVSSTAAAVESRLSTRMMRSDSSSRGWDVEEGGIPAAGVARDFR